MIWRLWRSHFRQQGRRKLRKVSYRFSVPMNFGSEGTFQPVKGKAMAQSYRVEFLRLHWTESITPTLFFSSIIENPWAKSKRHIFKTGLHIFSETSKLQQALVNFPWSNHPKERINTDKHPLSVSHEHPCKYITCSYALKDDWMMLTLVNYSVRKGIPLL